MAKLSTGKGKSSALPENPAEMFVGSGLKAEPAHPLKDESSVIATDSGNGTEEFSVTNRKPQETKSRRFQCVFKPSTFTGLQGKAAAAGVSVNDILNQLAESYIEGKLQWTMKN